MLYMIPQLLPVSLKLLSTSKNVLQSGDLVGISSLYQRTALEAFPFASPKTKCMSIVLVKENRLIVSSIIRRAHTYCKN
jgi:hypothetical protein